MRTYVDRMAFGTTIEREILHHRPHNSRSLWGSRMSEGSREGKFEAVDGGSRIDDELNSSWSSYSQLTAVLGMF